MPFLLSVAQTGKPGNMSFSCLRKNLSLCLFSPSAMCYTASFPPASPDVCRCCTPYFLPFNPFGHQFHILLAFTKYGKQVASLSFSMLRPSFHSLKKIPRVNSSQTISLFHFIHPFSFLVLELMDQQTDLR